MNSSCQELQFSQVVLIYLMIPLLSLIFSEGLELVSDYYQEVKDSPHRTA